MHRCHRSPPRSLLWQGVGVADQWDQWNPQWDHWFWAFESRMYGGARRIGSLLPHYCLGGGEGPFRVFRLFRYFAILNREGTKDREGPKGHPASPPPCWGGSGGGSAFFVPSGVPRFRDAESPMSQICTDVTDPFPTSTLGGRWSGGSVRSVGSSVSVAAGSVVLGI